MRWPSGKLETFKDVAADKIYTIVEGQGIQGSAPFSDLPINDVPIHDLPVHDLPAHLP